MKKNISFIIISLLISDIYSQKLFSVPYYNWSNHATFMLSHSPHITGYGYYSDSLSKAHHDTTFYEYNGEYYPIMSWADYYLWYVKKFWYQFNDPGFYEFAYSVKNDFWMAQYIHGNNFIASKSPSRIVVTCLDKELDVNYLPIHYIKCYLKKDLIGSYAKIENENKIDNTLNKDISKADFISKNQREKMIARKTMSNRYQNRDPENSNINQNPTKTYRADKKYIRNSPNKQDHEINHLNTNQYQQKLNNSTGSSTHLNNFVRGSGTSENKQNQSISTSGGRVSNGGSKVK